MKFRMIVIVLLCVICISSLTGCFPYVLFSNLNMNEVSEIESTQENVSYSYEEEYKNNCMEMSYESIFFGKSNLKDCQLKLNGFISEKKYFTSDEYDISHINEVIVNNDLKRDYFTSYVLSEDTNSYEGKTIRVVFKENSELSAKDYKSGSEIVMYGEIIHWSSYSVDGYSSDGYNTVWFVPKYIDII